jgi:hypothetical protein
VTPDDAVLLADELVGDLVAKLLGRVGESQDIAEENGDGVAEGHLGCSPRTAFALRVFVHSAALLVALKIVADAWRKTGAFQDGAMRR